MRASIWSVLGWWYPRELLLTWFHDRVALTLPAGSGSVIDNIHEYLFVLACARVGRWRHQPCFDPGNCDQLRGRQASDG